MAERWRALRLVVAASFRADAPRTVAAIVVQILAAANATLSGLWVKLLADGASRGAPAQMLVGAGGLALFVCGDVLLNAIGGQVNWVLREKTVHGLEGELLAAVARAPGLELHEDHAQLTQLELWQAESWQFSQAVPSLVALLFFAARLGLAGVLLAGISPVLLLLPLFSVPALLLSGQTSGLYLRGLEAAAEPSRQAQALFGLATQAGPAKEVRAFGLEAELLRRFGAAHREIQRIHRRLYLRAQVLSLVPRLLFAAGYAASIAYVTARAARGQASLGDVLLVAVLAGQVLGWVVSSADLVQFTLRTLAAVSRYLALLDAARPSPVATAVMAGRRAPPSRLREGIELQDVSFHYPGQAQAALDRVSLRLPAGAVVALVGDNGAGKTTLVKLLGRYYRPTAGTIRVDGLALDELDLEAWRACVSGVFQDYAKLELIARESVGLGHLPDVEREAAVRHALERAAAGALADRWPAGLATQLGATFPGGVELSGGEWQKVALARAMMRSGPLLLVLDEPAAALDPESEHELFARYAAAATQATRTTGAITLLVSHRFSTVRTADLIAVLEHGRLVEFGSHAALLARGGQYAELFSLQARAYG